MELRRQFPLPTQDVAFLESYGRPWETVIECSQWVLIHNVSSQHEGYCDALVTIAMRLEPGYPVAVLDMVYVYPSLRRKDGSPIPAADVAQTIDGQTFQRWSRHYTGEHPWVVGTDGLERHVLSIESWFRREFER